MNPKQPRDLGGGSIVLQHLLRFPDLGARQLGRAPEVAVGTLGRVDPATLSLAGLLPFKLGKNGPAPNAGAGGSQLDRPA